MGFEAVNGTKVRVESQHDKHYPNEKQIGGKEGVVVGTSKIYNTTWRVEIENEIYEVHDTYLKDLSGNYLPGLP